MIEIKTQVLRGAVQAAYEADKIKGTLVDHSDGQFTGNFYHEVYKRDGSTTTYYFEGNTLFGYDYEDVE